MNGLSDVRPILHNAQLQAEDETSHIVSKPADLNRWELFWHRARTRRTLRKLDIHELNDVGLSRELAQQEGCKPFWRP